MKTHSEHVRRVLERHNGEIIVLGAYRHSKTKVEYSCGQHTWWATPSNVEAGVGCKQCAVSRHRKSPEEHARRVRQVHGERIAIVGQFVCSTDKVEYHCPDHGAFYAIPPNIENGHGCMKCRNVGISKRCRKTHAQYLEELVPLGVEVLDMYVTALTPLRHRCVRITIGGRSPGVGCVSRLIP